MGVPPTQAPARSSRPVEAAVPKEILCNVPTSQEVALGDQASLEDGRGNPAAEMAKGWRGPSKAGRDDAAALPRLRSVRDHLATAKVA